ncbi:MAG: hypothetical protein GY839_12740 [candidate division Zixibacteria bacterium]|nr:hypothetical protein [candidate division Zixibacteria bacterium]
MLGSNKCHAGTLSGIHWKFVIAAILLFLPVQELTASVLVSPTVVFITDKNPTGRITLLNRGDTPQEVSVYFSFGLPISDSLGNLSVVFQDSAVTDPRSCLGWIKAFPKQVIIGPDESQVVRLMARAPDNLPDGEYWARIMVRSQGATEEVPVAGEQDGIQTQLNMITEMALMLKYRTGDLVSDMELQNASASFKDSMVEVMIDLENRGNVSYMGMLETRLLDSDNKEISSKLNKLAVYRHLKRRIDLEFIEGEFKAPFRVEIKIDSEGRNDVMPEDMIAGNKILRTVDIE